jgi:hypothetical protein
VGRRSFRDARPAGGGDGVHRLAALARTVAEHRARIRRTDRALPEPLRRAAPGLARAELPVAVGVSAMAGDRAVVASRPPPATGQAGVPVAEHGECGDDRCCGISAVRRRERVGRTEGGRPAVAVQVPGPRSGRLRGGGTGPVPHHRRGGVPFPDHRARLRGTDTQPDCPHDRPRSPGEGPVPDRSARLYGGADRRGPRAAPPGRAPARFLPRARMHNGGPAYPHPPESRQSEPGVGQGP